MLKVLIISERNAAMVNICNQLEEYWCKVEFCNPNSFFTVKNLEKIQKSKEFVDSFNVVLYRGGRAMKNKIKSLNSYAPKTSCKFLSLENFNPENFINREIIEKFAETPNTQLLSDLILFKYKPSEGFAPKEIKEGLTSYFEAYSLGEHVIPDTINRLVKTGQIYRESVGYYVVSPVSKPKSEVKPKDQKPKSQPKTNPLENKVQDLTERVEELAKDFYAELNYLHKKIDSFTNTDSIRDGLIEEIKTKNKKDLVTLSVILNMLRG